MSVNPHCKEYTVDFVVKDGDTEIATIEDDIKKDLAKIGIKVNTRFVSETDYIKIEENGDYNLFFTRSWGAPYDPHTYLNSWDTPAHVEYSSTGNLEEPMTRESLLNRIEAVQRELNEDKIKSQWKDILTDIHQQALFLPLWGTRVPYVLNRRLAGFTPSSQTYTYPIQNIRILDGSKNVTIAPGAGGKLLSSAGPIHPHQYFPNQLFTQAWVYEGLVSYGQDGEILPCLATNWTTDNLSTGQRVTFTLRENAFFHDGEQFNCSVAKLNFDHVLSKSAKQRHSWLGAVKAIKSWSCNDKDEFVLETNEPFYPLLQELTYIRPLTMASPSSFANGLDTDPEKANSCKPGASKWKKIEAIEDFTCAGLNGSVGTGPFQYVSRELNSDGTEKSVLFKRHDKYWGVKPEIEFVELQTFQDTSAVEAALLSEDLDMALGIGPLSAKQVQKLKFYDSAIVDVLHSDVLQNSLMVMNTNKAPTNDINVRKAIIHAVNKGRFIEEEFGGLEQPVDQLLPKSAPHCNIDLNPKWAYDPTKAELLNCPTPTTGESSNKLSNGAIAGISIASIVAAALAIFVMRLIQREKAGKPLFTPPEKGETA